jgi:hypothetical protein
MVRTFLIGIKGLRHLWRRGFCLRGFELAIDLITGNPTSMRITASPVPLEVATFSSSSTLACLAMIQLRAAPPLAAQNTGKRS